MSVNYNPYSNYQQDSITTLPNIDKIILLYKSAINSLKKVNTAIKINDYQSRYNHSEKVFEIIEGLANCLDHQQGGNIAIILESFYKQLMFEVSNLSYKSNEEDCSNVISKLESMLNTWQNIRKN